MSTVETLRSRLSAFYTAKIVSGIHSVTFQPRVAKKIEDRVVTEEWELLGQRWVFLAVCDGHGGSLTSDYTARELPGRIRAALTAALQDQFHGTLSREDIPRAEPIISTMLAREIEEFDAAIGQRVQDICPNPETFNEAQARAFNERHLEPLMLAFNGTTLSIALINLTHRFMWGAGVGDSSAVISTTNPDGTRSVQRACAQHAMSDPAECARACAQHPGEEVVIHGRILGSLMLPRAIGDFGLKLRAEYLGHIFKYLPFTGSSNLDALATRIKTPPYVSSTPSVQFTDLAPLWDSKPVVALFSDGVDLLVDGFVVFRAGKSSSNADPCEVVAKLLQGEVDPALEETLGHGVDLHWSGAEANKALDVLGNLIGGVNTERLEMMLDQSRFGDREGEPFFYVDDTAVVVFPLV